MKIRKEKKIAKKEKLKQKIKETDKNIHRIKSFLKFTIENATFTGSAFITFKYIE